ncbi:MAG: LamG domain-containing protein, partial [Candidatus Micrarchaeaceae archaeon]
VVLGALYSLGVFNSTNFAPKAPPGSCQVFRPNGPYTTSFINLMGVCNGEMPEYVANFNGGNSYIQLNNELGGASALTVSLWFNTRTLASGGAQYGWIDEEFVWGYKFGQPAATSFCFATTAGSWAWCAAPNTQYTFSTNTWYFIAFTYSNGNPVEFYVDGTNYPGPTESGVLTTGSSGPLRIGPAISTQNDALNGTMANVQLYNTSLSQAEITALYQEGIGGAPIDLQNLVGWWPLNGNANDYSGNGNNGVPSNVTFVSNWYSGYTPP